MNVRQLAREVNFAFETSDRAHDLLEDRVTRIEEIIAASWPRSIVLHWRLRHELRATDAQYAKTGATFRQRRSEWAADQVIVASQRTARRTP